jgi:hypothetical protein
LWQDCVNQIRIASADRRIHAAGDGWLHALKSIDALQDEVVALRAAVTDPEIWHGPTATAVGRLLDVLADALDATAVANRGMRQCLDDTSTSLQTAVARIPIPPGREGEVKSQHAEFLTSGETGRLTGFPEDSGLRVAASASVESLLTNYSVLAAHFPTFTPPKLPSDAFAPAPPGEKVGQGVPAATWAA